MQEISGAVLAKILGPLLAVLLLLLVALLLVAAAWRCGLLRRLMARLNADADKKVRPAAAAARVTCPHHRAALQCMLHCIRVRCSSQ